MDLDISDILADVSKPIIRQTQGHTSSTAGVETYTQDAQSSYIDHQKLVRAWTSERTCPSLLPYPTNLIERVMTRIQQQIIRIEDMSSGVVPSVTTSIAGNDAGRNRGGEGTANRNTNLILSILQTDLSRTQFVLRSYLRQRIAKIGRFAVFYLKNLDHFQQQQQQSSYGTGDGGREAERNPLLSATEIEFLTRHQALLSEFYDNSFLTGLPANLRRLDDSTGGANMVEGPDGAVGVVVRCLSERWDNLEEVEANSSGGNNEGEGVGIGDGKADVELRFRRGEVWVVRWRDVRSGVVKGDVELL